MSAKLVTLGGLSLKGAAFVRPKPLLLLAYLALEGPRDRYHLAELFWRDSANPLNSLAAAVMQLKQGAPGVVEAGKRQVWGLVACDASEFLGAFEGGRYEEALSLYQGPFLNGVYLPGWGAELEEWVYSSREFFGGRVREVFLRLGEEAAGRGAFEDAAGRAQAAYGLRGAAELEASEIERLYTLFCAAHHPQANELRQEGQDYGLTLTLSPEEARASLRTALEGQSSEIPHNLPLRATSFIGRELERAELATLLQEDRLISLVGLAGIGKSRLALQVAYEGLEGRSFTGGVYFIPLEALTSPGFIPASIAEGLSLSLQGGEDPLRQVVRHIGTKHTLLVLDNYEHLLAPPARMSAAEPQEMDGAVLAAELLKGCPDLKLLVTSRERLNLAEEVVVSLEGLRYPEAPLPPNPLQQNVNWEDFDALKLFIERAGRARPGFTLSQEDQQCIITVCRLVEGAPLGIELASAWVRLMSCAEIAQEIEKNLDFLTTSARDAPERHKSIRAVFEHSWKLLTPKEQEVFKKLSVFQGGFTREAATEVAGVTIPVLASLADKSLLRVTASGRYDRHPLLYGYSKEKLAEHPEEQARTLERHGVYYARFLRARNLEMKGAGQKEGLSAMAEELENIRAAWQWALAEQRLEELQEAVEPLTLFYDRQARYQEGIELLGEAVTSLSEADPHHQLALGNALVGQAFLYQWSSNYQEAVRLARRGLELLRPLGESWGIMVGLDTLGFVAAFTGNFAEGKRCWTEALALAKAQDNAVKTAELLSIMGMTEYWQGNQAEAEAYLDDAMVLTPPLGKHTAVIYILLNLGFINILNNPKKAQLAFQQGLHLARELGYRRHLPYLLYGLGWALHQLGQYPQAQAFCKQAIEVAKESGNLFAESMALTILGVTTAGLHDYT
ncbi:MAG: NACHT domain-containing protein, partial [Deinococcota bacterium]|nr:NACHT domain-containing protein [Deinococcota bacterium]